MPFIYTSTKVVGNPDGSGWVQVHDYTPDTPQKLAHRGRLYAVISTQAQNPGEIDLAQNGKLRLEMGREILARLHEEYYGQLEGNAFDCLVGAVSRVSSEFTSRELNVEIGACVFLSGKLLGACANGAVLLVLRAGQLVPLLTTQRGNHLSVSGLANAKDKVVIGTQQLLHTVSMGVLKGALETEGLDEFSETISPKVLGSETSSSTAVLVIEIENDSDSSSFSQPPYQVSLQPEVVKRSPNIRARLIGVIDTVLEKLPDPRLRVKADTIDVETHKRRKSLPLVGFLILIILGISIVFGVKQKDAREKEAALLARISEVEREFEEAQSLVGLNKSRAKELLLSARARAMDLKDEGQDSQALDSLLNKISESLGPVAGVYEVEPELYLDTTLVSSGFSADQLVYSDESILIMDSGAQQVVSVELENKTTEFVAGPDYLKDAIDLAFYAGRSFVLSSDGVREVTDDVELVIKPEDWEPSQALISAFAGNLYVLDRKNNQIWRYPGIRLGLSQKEAWLTDGVETDFSEAIGMGIDGSVWVLAQNGRLEKYTRGNKDSFSLDSESNLSFSKFYIDENSEYLYFYDSSQTRFLKFSKGGKFEAEYINTQFTGIDGFVVTESQNKLVYLKEGKLYEFKVN